MRILLTGGQPTVNERGKNNMMYEDISAAPQNYGKFFIKPQDPADREFISAVSLRTRSDLDIRYGFIIDYEWMVNTVANVFFECMVRQLKSIMLEQLADSGQNGASVGFKFYDLFSSIVSNKINEHAEKEGNLNIYFDTGERVDYLIANGIPSTDSITKTTILERFLTDDQEENEVMLGLDKICIYELSKSHGLRLGNQSSKLISVAIAYTFFENLFIELLVRAAKQKKEQADANDDSDAMVSVNFNDNIEFHCVVKDGTASIMMRPGMNVKMLIKSDEFTEKTMGDLDD